MKEGIPALAVAACACDLSRYELLSRCGLMPADEAGLATILDQSSLRVRSEDQVHGERLPIPPTSPRPCLYARMETRVRTS